MAAAAVATEAGQTGGKRPEPPSLERLAIAFPQLDVLEFIGQGGMGAVYKARQKQLDRIVALKVLPPGIGGDPAFAERFTREAKALAKLLHPNIVALFEFGQADGIFFLLMEFVDGVSLGQLLRSSRISPREALAIVPQICDALQYAHDQGIVHRDIKPENILLDRRGRVKVADFGLAKLVGGDGSPERPAGTVGSAVPASLTEAGKVMGTPNYMAPEQAEHPAEVDHRADIYALGVVFYQMLTGELPGKRLEAPSTKVQIDVRLDEVVMRALERRPELRYQQVSDVKTMVETIATTPGVETPGMPPVKNETGGRLGGIVLVGSCNGKRVINWDGVVCAAVIAYGAILAGLIVAFGRYVPLASLASGTVGIAIFVTAILVKVGLKLPIERLTPFDPAASRNWSTSFPGRSVQEREICAHLTAAERSKMGWLMLLFLPGNMVLFLVLIAFVDHFKHRMDNVTFACAFVFLIALLLGWLRLWRWKARQALYSTAWARQKAMSGNAGVSPAEPARKNSKGKMVVLGRILLALLVLAIAGTVLQPISWNKSRTKAATASPSSAKTGASDETNAFWIDYLRLNQSVEPDSSSGESRYGDDAFNYEATFNGSTSALTIRYRQEPSSKCRVLF